MPQPDSQEYVVNDGQYLVSRTDLRGVITHANEAFVQASGYTRQELIGRPHNLIRHADMPAAGFADLWATVKSGRSWVGIVKNRRKDGRYYWVHAAISPVFEGREAIGYISVRVKPEAAEIAAADQLYAQLRAGDRSYRLRYGRVLRNGPLAAVGRFFESGVMRLSLAMLLVVGLLALACATAITGMRNTQADIASMQAIAHQQQELAEAKGLEISLLQRLISAARDDSAITDLTAKAKADQARADALWAALRRSVSAPAVFEAHAAWRDKVIDRGLSMAVEGRRQSLMTLITTTGISRCEVLTASVESFQREQQAALAAIELHVGRESGRRQRNLLVMAVVATAIAVLAGLTVSLSLRRRVRAVAQGMEAVAAGRLQERIDVSGGDEFAGLLRDLVTLRTRIGYAVDHEQEQRASTMRELNAALGGVVDGLAASIDALSQASEAQLGAAQRLTGGAQAVATAATEMDATTRDMATQTTGVSQLAREAAGRAGEGRATIQQLADAANEATGMVRLIAGIADRTNLLALNASIEAARAGSAGRGFAVVAEEVKALAGQAGVATRDIGTRITAIQTHATAVVSAFTAVADELGRLDGNANAIAAAVEQQSSTTAEIARNADQAADDARATSGSAEAVAAASEEIAKRCADLGAAMRSFTGGMTRGSP